MNAAVEAPLEFAIEPGFTLPERLRFAKTAVHEAKKQLVYNRPITFEEWLKICGPTDFYELIDGVLVKQEMVQLEHEQAETWIKFVLGGYANARKMGMMLGSRSALMINPFRGRLPDLFFVRQEHVEIVQQKATYGTPDLVFEILSPNDRRGNIIALETDYRLLAVPEIVFVDVQRQTIRLLRRGETDYTEESYSVGSKISFAALDGLTLKTEWILREPRPEMYPLLTALLNNENPADEGSL